MAKPFVSGLTKVAPTIEAMELTEVLKSNTGQLRPKQIYTLVLRLCMPAILMQLAQFAMQYIDAAMVGSLGASASAAISVVFSSIWIAIGLGFAVTSGFSVQIAHAIGANDTVRAKQIFREGLIINCGIACTLSVVGICLSSRLPSLLGADPKIWKDASAYFFIYACFMPIIQLRIFSASVLQCAGDTKTPGILNSLLCLLDVIFNYFMIFPTHDVMIGHFLLHAPGAGLGVAGAALGSVFSEAIIAIVMFLMAFKQPNLHFKFVLTKFSKSILRAAAKISSPMAVESLTLNGAHILITCIVAPLGTVALAADIFGFTAEQICFLPGFGISIAATTLVGQALGAHREDLAHKFAWTTVKFGSLAATMVAIALYIFAPAVFACLTPDEAVQKLGVTILRIELWAEPLFAASTVIVGVLRGAKDTFGPSAVTLICKLLVLIPLALLLVKKHGLVGVWIAIFADFCVRGILLLLRLRNVKSWGKCNKTIA